MITQIKDRVKNRVDGFYWVRWEEEDCDCTEDWQIMEWSLASEEWFVTGSDLIIREYDIYLVDESRVTRGDK